MSGTFAALLKSFAWKNWNNEKGYSPVERLSLYNQNLDKINDLTDKESRRFEKDIRVFEEILAKSIKDSSANESFVSKILKCV